METSELIDQIEHAPIHSREALDRLRLYVTAGDNILPEFAPYLEEAKSYHDFFNAVYADENRKNSNVWAEWAKLARKSWIERFDAKIALRGLRLKSDGLPIEMGSGVVLAPTGSRDSIANFYLFASGAFNTEATDFVTSIGGSFTCAGYDFTGVYGVYKYRGSVIFEEWQVEGDPVPTKKG